MCEPTTIAVAVMAVTSAASAVGQYQTAGAQAEAQTKRYELNKKRSYEALGQQYGDISERQRQEQHRASEKKANIYRQSQDQQATARVMAGESGITGNAVDMTLQAIQGNAGRARTNVNTNLEWTMGQLQRQKTSAQTGAANQVASMSRGQKPSSTALGVSLANTAASGYMQYDSVKANPGKGGTGAQGGTYEGGYFKYG